MQLISEKSNHGYRLSVCDSQQVRLYVKVLCECLTSHSVLIQTPSVYQWLLENHKNESKDNKLFYLNVIVFPSTIIA